MVASKEEEKKSDRTIGRRRKETERWNQMAALSFQTGGGHQTPPPASLRANQRTERRY